MKIAKIKSILFAFLLFVCYIVSSQDNIENLLDAIKTVESSGGVNLYGLNGEIGPYQIKRIVIDDVNRICGGDVFDEKDAMDDKKSREICKIYIKYWADRKGRSSIEDMARIWNGGPNGYRKKSTIPYWNKIRGKLCL